MIAFPKPKVTTKNVSAPKLTEEDFIQISEKIAEAMEHKYEVEISVFYQKRLERVTGVITDADSQTGILKLYVNRENVRISINNIVAVN